LVAHNFLLKLAAPLCVDEVGVTKDLSYALGNSEMPVRPYVPLAKRGEETKEATPEQEHLRPKPDWCQRR